MRNVFRVCPHRLDPLASAPRCEEVQDGPPKLMQQEKMDVPADGSNGESLHTFVYMRRRPMHPGRFLAFTRQRFGPLGALNVETVAARPEHQGIGGRWSAAVDEMTCTPCRPVAGADNGPMDAEQRASLVTEARGCLWFVFSDDVQALWRFDPPKTGGPGVWKAEGSHLLRVGLPWDATSHAEKSRQAGVRRVELTFVFKGKRTDGVDAEVGESADEDHAWRLEETAIRAELDACLVTRDEAAALESGETLEGMEEWETLRLGHDHMSPWVKEWTPVLKPLLRSMELLSRLPGISLAGALGGAINARASNLVPHGHT